jgi:hypothetical protein
MATDAMGNTINPGPYFVFDQQTKQMTPAPPDAQPDPSQGMYDLWVLQPGGTYGPAILNPDTQSGPDSQKVITYDPNRQMFKTAAGGWISPAAMPELGGGSPQPGGLFTNRGEWDSQSGSFQNSTNWGNILSLVVAGVITAGAADAIMSGAPAAEAVTAAGGTPEAAASATAAATADTAAAGGGTAFAGAAPSLASTGEATVASTAVPAADLGTSSTIAGVSSAGGSGGGTLGQLAPALNAAGKGIGAATTAAGQNQLNAGNLAIQANNSNTSGQSAYQNEMMGLHNAEQTQRNTEGTNVARASFLENQKPGPFNTQGLTPLSPNYVSTLNALSAQGTTDLSQAPKYGATALPTPPPYKPINPAQYTTPSTLQNIGNYVAPALSTLGALAQYY